MCGGAEYRIRDPRTGELISRRVYYPIPHARLPVLRDNRLELVQWGKRRGEDPEAKVLSTGWARWQSIKEGKWDKYQPEQVYIPVLRWMDKDEAGISHWFDMDPGTALLGALVHSADKDFVYVVTTIPPAGHFHDRIPLIVKPQVSMPEEAEAIRK